MKIIKEFMNKAFSFINFGSIVQKNININNFTNNSLIKELLYSIDIHFYNGEIVRAFELINSTLKEHSDKTSKYLLFLKKAEYFLNLNNLKEAKKVLDLLKKDYSDHKDEKYTLLSLFIYSNENEEDFWEVLKDLETESNDTELIKYCKVIFYINSKDIEKAKEIFNSLNKESQKKYETIKRTIFILSDNNYYNQDKKNLKEINIYYDELSSKNFNFFDRFNIEGFFAQVAINDYFRTKKIFDKRKLLKYKKTLDKFLEAKNYLNEEDFKELMNFKAYLYLALKKEDEYIKFYKNNPDLLFDEHYIQYCNLSKKEIDHKLIQENLQKSKYLLIFYADLLQIEKERKIILEYFNKETSILLKESTVIELYIKYSIQDNYEISFEIQNYINSESIKDLSLYFSYLLLKNYKNEIIKNDEINFLFTLIKKQRIWNEQIFDIIYFLKKIKKSQSYIKLCLLKKNEFPKLVEYTLQQIIEDKEIQLEDFENFIKNIDLDQNNNLYFADIYLLNFKMFKQAFEYYYNSWKTNKNLIIIKNILIIIYENYKKTQTRINEEKEEEILNYLQFHIKELDFEYVILFCYLNLLINRNISSAFKILNEKILILNIEKENIENQKMLGEITCFLIFYFKDEEAKNCQENSIYYKNNKYYLDKNLFKSINDIYLQKFEIELVNKIEINKIKNDESYKKTSLFYLIVNLIKKNMESPNFRILELPIFKQIEEDLKKLLAKQQSFLYSDNLTKYYNNSSSTGFWNLTKDYNKYFNLIQKLIEDESLNFNSCNLNYKEKNIPKLITFSSIIFLYYWNKLDKVLKRDDVYIQKSTFEYITSKILIENLKKIIENIPYPKVIDDSKMNFLFENIINENHIGIQEYRAISFAFNNQFQLITEDRIIQKIYKICYDETKVSNSLCLLDRKEEISFFIQLHKNNYKYIFSFNDLEYFVSFIQNNYIVNALEEIEIQMIKIFNDYGWLEGLKIYYKNNFKVLYPKTKLPKENWFSKNIEYILKQLE